MTLVAGPIISKFTISYILFELERTWPNVFAPGRTQNESEWIKWCLLPIPSRNLFCARGPLQLGFFFTWSVSITKCEAKEFRRSSSFTVMEVKNLDLLWVEVKSVDEINTTNHDNLWPIKILDDKGNTVVLPAYDKTKPQCDICGRLFQNFSELYSHKGKVHIWVYLNSDLCCINTRNQKCCSRLLWSIARTFSSRFCSLKFIKVAQILSKQKS